MERIDFFEPADVKSQPLRPKASIHKSGKLGFDSDANEFMGLRSGHEFLVGYGNEGPTEKLILLDAEEDDPEVSKISVAKAGEYYYLNLRNFFDKYEVDYENCKIRYDIARARYEGREGYVLDQRVRKER